MLPTCDFLKQRLKNMLVCKAAQGHDVAGLETELPSMPDSYDAVAEFAERIHSAPLRADWPYVEPNDWDGIQNECAPRRATGVLREIDPAEACTRAEAAFYGAVAGCILGKPLECNPTLTEIRTAAEKVGQWPINDYISMELLEALGRTHGSAHETTRGSIDHVASDDDINYTIIGMLMIEEHGIEFTKKDLMWTWLGNLAPMWCWGPERTLLLKSALWSMQQEGEPDFELWAGTWNPGSELCGATIRADAYGYACPGRPQLAAELAWRDASWTHRRTGVYGAMYCAAAIATAAVADDPFEIFATALDYVPRRSRFFEIINDCLGMVRQASDWLDGYARIHAKYKQYDHCKVYQEVGTMINTAVFAHDVGEGICMQVSQGCDTDCFGEIIGSILGMYFGPGHLEQRWLAPFNDTIHTGLAAFHEQRLSAVAQRMGQLPQKVISTQ